MTNSTTGDLERRVARGICHSKGIDPDMCVAGHGAMPGEPGFICQQYAWELELPTTRAALKAHAEWLEERNKVSNDWPCLLAKLLVQKGAGYHHDHPFWDFSGLQSEDLRQIQAMITAKQEDQHHD